MTHAVKAPKKLIEVALPLDAINEAAAREKHIRHGHPSTLHLWWARRPLAAARAVIFAQLVNDPSWKWEQENPGKLPPSNLKASWAASRKRLFALITDLVRWENANNEEVLEKARSEIRRSWQETCELNKDHPRAAELFNPEILPGLHDPFAGGGSIPLEAQRLGLEAFASDLNPVAVLINKAMIEIPPKFAGHAPVGPVPMGAQVSKTTWPQATGLAEDVRRYGLWMRAEAEKRIGHMYPQVEITPEMAKERPDLKARKGQRLKVIAWLWARTVRSPSPAFSAIEVPLVSNFLLATKEGKEAWVEPVVKGSAYRFVVRTGEPPPNATAGTKAAGRGSDFRCILSGSVISGDYIKQEGNAGRLGARLMAVACEGERTRIYLSPNDEMEKVAKQASPSFRPTGPVPARLTGGTCVPYGLREWGDLFTARQLVALGTFTDLVAEARDLVRRDWFSSGGRDDGRSLEDGGNLGTAYADAIAVLLGLGVSRFANPSSSLCTWNPGKSKEDIRYTFGRQALPMTWDFAEGNPFSSSSGNFADAFETWLYKAVMMLGGGGAGLAVQSDAQSQELSLGRFVSTDPPYYDNIAYADLSDFFYVWLRRSLRPILPSLFATTQVPKGEELVASAYRHGGREQAEKHFLEGMTAALGRIARLANPAAPTTIYYAFKQSETGETDDTSSTGWETFLAALCHAGFAITGTWPMRTEKEGRAIGNNANALASSIILACRRRADSAAAISRRDFLRELNLALPVALDEMTKGSGDAHSPVAPVDLSQAIIGPGMAVFSKYSAVLEADGSPMTVKTALQLINRFLAEDDFDPDTQFCLHWFEQFGWAESLFGEADKLARAKATSVEGLDEAGVVFSGKGKVRLRKWSDYSDDWDPRIDKRLPIWEALHQLIRVFKQDGESGAGEVLAAVQSKSEAVRQLAYRLYTLCERQGWAEDARAYNELVAAWSAIESAAAAEPKREDQLKLFGGDA